MRKSIFSKFIIYLTILFLSFPAKSFCGTPERARHGMVVSANKLASEIGVRILQQGGNAVDAAVAVGFGLAVTFPAAGNIGGGGFMVIHLNNGTNTTIDFRETAPLFAYEKMYLDSLENYVAESSQIGWKSAGVPGTISGLIYALKKYGTMKLSELIQPAIDLAENGFLVNYELSESVNKNNKEFNFYEASKKIFTKDGSYLVEGDLFLQKDLANCLRLIRDGGQDEFYKGKIADRIISESNKHGGIFLKEDFENYKPIERAPVIGSYRGYEIISMAPPSSGGVALIEALNILENYSFSKDMWASSKYVHLLVETMKFIYKDRALYLGDPDFVDVPVNKLISKKYAKNLFNSISDSAVPSNEIYNKYVNDNDSYETTHYSIIDPYGNAVSTTYTLNSSYGNKIVVDGLGFLLNNEMDDFSVKPGVPNQFGLIGSKANSIQPRKRMLSSMTPTIILRDGKPFMIIGSPGGSTIITSVLQTILNVIDFDMNIYNAIAAPKFHHQLFPDEINFENFGVTEEVKRILIEIGHQIGPDKSLGRMEGIVIDQVNNVIYGASDPRGYGKAIGY